MLALIVGKWTAVMRKTASQFCLIILQCSNNLAPCLPYHNTSMGMAILFQICFALRAGSLLTALKINWKTCATEVA